jgi:hypothetical protein
VGKSDDAAASCEASDGTSVEQNGGEMEMEPGVSEIIAVTALPRMEMQRGADDGPAASALDPVIAVDAGVGETETTVTITLNGVVSAATSAAAAVEIQTSVAAAANVPTSSISVSFVEGSTIGQVDTVAVVDLPASAAMRLEQAVQQGKLTSLGGMPVVRAVPACAATRAVKASKANAQHNWQPYPEHDLNWKAEAKVDARLDPKKLGKGSGVAIYSEKPGKDLKNVAAATSVALSPEVEAMRREVAERKKREKEEKEAKLREENAAMKARLKTAAPKK